MKKILCVILAAIMSISMLAGCSNNKNMANTADEKLNIVVTIFPEYDWVKNIVGDKANITLLMDNGADLHNYQPSASDIVKIKNSDLFVYVGGESDEWVEDLEDDNINMISLLEIVGDNAKEEELVKGMQGEDEEETSEEDEEGPEYDEHVWLSLNNAQVIVKKLDEEIEKLDAENKEFYELNTKLYIDKIKELNSKYNKLANEKTVDTVIFGDRFPFRYLTDDLGLNYYAAFIGCSAETEASFETISFLTDKVKELNCDYIFTIENSDNKIANSIISASNTSAEIVTLNSMQNITRKDIEDGVDYLSIMEDNYKVLVNVLK